MTEELIRSLLERQHAYFCSGATLDIPFRLEALHTLRRCIRQREADIAAALHQDLGKSAFEGYLCETGMVLEELRYMLRRTPAFARAKTVPTPLAQFPARSFQLPAPRGVTLIMSPWNYPFLLTIGPLIDALAAGNTAILKPSAYAPATSALVEELISVCFDPSYVAVVTGGREENTCLLKQPFDLIFFTGSQRVGRTVMRAAAEHLTPVILELGGKSPCIVDRTANLRLAARRIVFGKFLNCGQTCVAPDYILCHRSVADDLLVWLEREIVRQYGQRPLDNPDYGRIVSQRHFDRLVGLMASGETAWGGKTRPETLQIEPTLLTGVAGTAPVMREEIFGPLLPILPFDTLEQAIAFVNDRPHPLALYCFTSDRAAADALIRHCGFGGGCINDTIIHLATSEMGFGGFRESGMGSYHGRAGFQAFSHYKSIVDKKTWLDLPMRYQPYTERSRRVIRRFLK